MTSTAILSQGSSVSIQSSSSGAKTISGAQIGNPVILTATAHGMQNGDVATIAAIVGTLGTAANGLNGNSYVIRRVTANTFSIDFDATGLVYTSGGTATPITWQAIANVKTFAAFDGAAANIDVSNLASTAKEYLVGLQDLGQLTLGLDLDATDLGQQALLAALGGQAKKSFKIVLPVGSPSTATFSGFVKKVGADGGVDKSVTRAVDILVTGPVTWS